VTLLLTLFQAFSTKINKKTLHQFSVVSVVLLAFVLGVFYAPLVAHAQTVSSTCGNVDYTDPSIAQLICPFIAFINVVILIGGAVFVGVILIASYKYATSQGDPKGTMAAQQTITYAVVGFVGVIGIFVLLTVVGNLFGFDSDLLGVGVYDRIIQFTCAFLTDDTASEPIIASLPGCN
jgi:hypothetical protein